MINLTETRKLKQEKYLTMLKQHLSTNSNLVFAKEYQKANLYPTVSMVVSVFCSWRNALILLGIDVNVKGMLG